MKSDRLRAIARERMTGKANLYFKLTDEQKLKARQNSSKAKLGGKNPNAKRCMWLVTDTVYDSGNDMRRALNLKKSIGYYIRNNLATWI